MSVRDAELSRPRSAWRWIWVVAGMLALAGVCWIVVRTESSEAKPPPRGPAPVPVAVMTVTRRDVPELTRNVGTVQSLHSVVIRPQVDGVLTQVLFEEGARIEAGQLLARIDDRSVVASLASGEAEKARNEAQLVAAERDLVRYQNLLKEQAISGQAVDQQLAEIAQLKATLRANEATIAATRVQLSFTRISSPVNGRAGLRRVDVGNVVRASDTDGLVSVTQMDPISVVFSLSQDLLPRLRKFLDDPSSASVAAYDRDAGERIATGKLGMIDNQIDVNTGTIRLRAEFANPDGALWPGQFVTVELATGMHPNALVVAPSAVQRGLDRPFVFRVKDGKAEVVQVEVAYENEEFAVLRHGVAEGDVLVVDGQSRLKAGTPVKIAKPGRGSLAAAEGGGDHGG
jgi:membrane fusion protein, multidrug efflux system